MLEEFENSRPPRIGPIYLPTPLSQALSVEKIEVPCLAFLLVLVILHLGGGQEKY